MSRESRQFVRRRKPPQRTHFGAIALARQRLRKVVSKLRSNLRDGEADDHLVINRGGDAKNPECTMILRFGRKH